MGSDINMRKREREILEGFSLRETIMFFVFYAKLFEVRRSLYSGIILHLLGNLLNRESWVRAHCLGTYVFENWRESEI